MPIILVAHYIIGFCSLLFNIALLPIVAKQTPKQHRINGHLIFEECIFLAISSVTNVISMQRLIPIPHTTIFASLGVCTQISSYFCYYLHVLTVGAFACSFFIASYQLIFRQRLLSGVMLDHVRYWWIPTSLCVIGIHINVALHQTNSTELERIVRFKFSEYIEENSAINGHDSFSIPVIIVNGFYVTCLILPIMWITVFFLRRSVLSLLTTLNSNLSERSRYLQRQLVQMVTITAYLSFASLWPALVYFLGQFVVVNSYNFLDSCFFFIQLHCAVAPLVIVYYVPNYRKQV